MRLLIASKRLSSIANANLDTHIDSIYSYLFQPHRTSGTSVRRKCLFNVYMMDAGNSWKMHEVAKDWKALDSVYFNLWHDRQLIFNEMFVEPNIERSIKFDTSRLRERVGCLLLYLCIV